MPYLLRERLTPPSRWRQFLTEPGLLTLCSLLITLGFFAICTIVLQDARQDAARQADQAAANIAAAVEHDVARNIELFDQSLQSVNDGLQLPGIWDLSPQLRNMILFDSVSKARYLGFVNALDEAGNVIADSRAMPPRGGNYAHRDYFRDQRYDPRDELFIGRPILTGPDRSGSITISRRRTKPDGSFGGVVVGSMQLAYFRNLFSGFSIGPHGTISLLRTDGTILTRLPFDSNDVGRVIPPSSPFYTFMRTREARVDGVIALDNLPRRFTYRQIGNLPLVVSVGFATEDIFASWRLKAAQVLLLVVGLCAANLVLTWLLRRQVLRRASAEATFRQVTENVSDVITCVDTLGVCTYASPAAWQTLRVAPEVLLRHRLADYLHPADRDAFELWLARLNDGSADRKTRFRMQRPDGGDVWIEAVASTLYNSSTRQPEGFVILSRDVTVQHELELANAERESFLERSNVELNDLAHKLAHAANEADRAREEKQRFLATMSHEVRTPLTCILGYAELLSLEGHLDPLQSERVATMRSAGEHLRDVLDHVLHQSRQEALKRTRLTRNDVSALVQQVRAQIEPVASAKGLPVRGEIDSDVPHDIVTDAACLRQILLNLLHNAVKYTTRGEILLRVSRHDDLLRCQVIDTGIGVPAAMRSRLFREYDRLDADQTSIEGTGLGLATTTRWAEALGGTIGHADNPGGGSIFWVDLPIGTEYPEPAAMPEPGAARTPPRHVLVVDDAMVNRDVASRFLRSAGHTVAEAATGEAAIHLAAAEDFDAVLMDMLMPDIDGVEAARRIRNLPGRRRLVPIVAVTAQVLDERWNAWSCAGIDRYLAKPYTRTELLEAVRLATAGSPSDNTVSAAAPAVTDPHAALAELRQVLGPETLDCHLHTLADQVGELAAALHTGDASDDLRPLVPLAHRIAGDSGQLGFVALSAAARTFMEAAERHSAELPAAIAALLAAAAQTEDFLHQNLSPARNASMTSAKLA